MTAIEWAKLANREVFDRVVEAFLVIDNADLADDAYVVNGRGGDGGIDIRMRRDDRLVIVQLKFFPEGFAGNWGRVRRPQIARSFKKALSHDPDEWWLVVPTTLTPGERSFVTGLASSPGSPVVRVFDRPNLDGLAARHPGLVTFFHRDELDHAARTYSQERALMFHQRDVVERVTALAEQADTLDPDWRIEVRTFDGVTASQLVPKHPHAAARSPITLNLTVKFDATQSALMSRFEQTMRFGAPSRIDLPASVVSSFRVDGPAAFARTEENVELSFVPGDSAAVGLPFTLAFYEPTATESDQDDVGAERMVASYTGTTTWGGAGDAGATVHVTFFEAVTLKFSLPREGNSSSVNVALMLEGCEPASVVRAVNLLEHLDGEHSIHMELDGLSLGRLLPHDGKASVFGDFREAAMQHRETAADLDFVQKHTSQYFAYPKTVDLDERLHLRCLRLLLEGKCIVAPNFDELTATLSGDQVDELPDLIGKFPGPIAGQMESFSLDLFGKTFELGPIKMYAPRVELVDAHAHLAAIAARQVAGRSFTLRACDGHGMWLYLEERFETPDGHVRPVSLGLLEYADSPDVATARAALKGA